MSAAVRPTNNEGCACCTLGPPVPRRAATPINVNRMSWRSTIVYFPLRNTKRWSATYEHMSSAPIASGKA
jgi:hypothetical protein